MGSIGAGGRSAAREENVNYQKDVSASEGANADNRMVKMSNLPSPPQEEESSKVIQQGPLTFDPLPPTVEAKDVQLLAVNDQAKLMQWNYRLGHLSFPKLKQLALNGTIPKKLAKVLPPKCIGCLAGQCSLYRMRWHQLISCHAGHHAHVLGSIWGQVLCTLGMSILFST